MDPQTQNFGTDDTPDELSPVFRNWMLDALRHTLPASGDDGPEAQADRWEAARALFETMRPRNPVEAMLAARAVAAHHASMDLYGRAARPGTTAENAVRLRSGAIRVSRLFDAALRALEDRRSLSSGAAQAGRFPQDAAPAVPMKFAPMRMPLSSRPQPFGMTAPLPDEDTE